MNCICLCPTALNTRPERYQPACNSVIVYWFFFFFWTWTELLGPGAKWSLMQFYIHVGTLLTPSLHLSVSSGLHRPQLFGPWGVHSWRVSLSARLGWSQLWDCQGHVPGPVFRPRHLQHWDQYLYLQPELDWARLLFRYVMCCNNQCIRFPSIWFYFLSHFFFIYTNKNLNFYGTCKSSITPGFTELIKCSVEDNEVQDQRKWKQRKIN